MWESEEKRGKGRRKRKGGKAGSKKRGVRESHVRKEVKCLEKYMDCEESMKGRERSKM